VIQGISWAADGRSLVFAATWCKPDSGFPGFGADASRPDTQVRSLDVAAGGGALDRGTVLLTHSARYPVIVTAAAGSRASELTVLVLSGHMSSSGWFPKVAVERVSAVSGKLLGVEYRSAANRDDGHPHRVWITSDPSGRYLLFTYFSLKGRVSQWWIGGGRLHPLPAGFWKNGPWNIAW
jgi:hypothetical protein